MAMLFNPIKIFRPHIFSFLHYAESSLSHFGKMCAVLAHNVFLLHIIILYADIMQIELDLKENFRSGHCSVPHGYICKNFIPKFSPIEPKHV